MKKIAWLTAAATLVVAGAYSVVSLGRWEWTRALYFGLVFLAAEVALSTGLILRRLGPTPRRSARDVDPQTLAILRANRPPRPNRFDWLDPVSGTDECLHHDAGRRRRPPVRHRPAGGQGRFPDHDTRGRGGAGCAARPHPLPAGRLLVDDVTVLAQAVPGVEDPQLRRLLHRSGHGG